MHVPPAMGQSFPTSNSKGTVRNQDDEMAASVHGKVQSTLCITETWIRERLNLQLDSLADVRSLSLPGSYSEKATHLGRSLLGFTRLKHLDLSRNAIESLEGIDHLKHLETLNLYYNNISSLNEVFRLRHNVKLRELDLRLNPVTKNEPDYRLFIIHMLVNLRRLDDRSVRDSERKAALMHFDTDQACELDGRVQLDSLSLTKPDVIQPDVSKHIKSRTQLVQSLAPRPTALEDDTDELLDLIARNDRLLTPTRHSNSGILQQNHPSPPPTTTGPVQTNLNNGNLEFTDEPQAYVDHKVKGHFTPAPRTMQTESLKEPPPSDAYSVDYSAVDELLGLLQEHIPSDLSALRGESTFRGKVGQWLEAHLPHPVSENAGLEQQLELKDSIIQKKDLEFAGLQQKLRQRESEAAVLGRQLQLQTSELEEQKQSTTSHKEIQQLLEQATNDTSSLKQLVQTLQQENTSLKVQVSTTSDVQKQLRQLGTENQSLRVELKAAMERHQQDVKCSSQVQELAAMLQESHRSLVATNDHLLQELEETKERHMQEIMQMNANYEHLRKTIQFMQAM